MRHALAVVVTVAVLLLLTFVAPPLGQARFDRLRDRLRYDPSARLRFYVRFLVSGWVVALGAVAVAAVGRGPAALGLRWYGGRAALTLVVAAVAAIAFVGFMVAFGAVLQRVRPALVSADSPLARLGPLLPETKDERRVWPFVAVIAGVAEEAVFRGLLLLHWHALTPRLGLGLLAVLTSVAFGAGHRYQGVVGTVGATALGGAFAAVTVASRSVVPAMVLHALWDLRVPMAARTSVPRR